MGVFILEVEDEHERDIGTVLQGRRTRLSSRACEDTVTTDAAWQGKLAGSKANAKPSLHHVGFVVSSILKEIENFAGYIDAYWDEKIFHDPLQKTRVTFLRTPCPTDALIELVEPVGVKSPVFKFLQKGGGLHHLCYEVDDIDAHLKLIQREGAIVVRRPLPAVAFENRRIAWALSRQKLLLEYLERKQLLEFP